MQQRRNDWLDIAIAIRSYRQMYQLADRIMDCADAAPEYRRAARKVVTALRGVIDQPIAAASE